MDICPFSEKTDFQTWFREIAFRISLKFLSEKKPQEMSYLSMYEYSISFLVDSQEIVVVFLLFCYSMLWRCDAILTIRKRITKVLALKIEGACATADVLKGQIYHQMLVANLFASVVA